MNDNLYRAPQTEQPAPSPNCTTPTWVWAVIGSGAGAAILAPLIMAPDDVGRVLALLFGGIVGGMVGVIYAVSKRPKA